MTKRTGGLRDRRRPDVMELLARARPARLDASATEQPAEVAARLAAADHTVAGTPPDHVVRDRAVAGTGAASHPPRRVPRAAVLAVTGLAAGAVAVAVAVLAVTAGGQGAPGRGTRAPVLLTAAMVRQVASASRAALALSGRATISYADTQAGELQDTGTDRITFSGKNWNDAFSQSFPASHGQPASSQFAINRIVGKQFYLYIKGRTDRLAWYRDTNPSGHPGFTIPDPRTAFAMLEPSARFEVAGYQVIDGIRLKILRATDLSHLAGLASLPDIQPGERVTALEVWVDGHGVVHRISLTARQDMTVYQLGPLVHTRGGGRVIYAPNRASFEHLRAKLKKAGLTGRPIQIRMAGHGTVKVRHEVQVTTLTVTFSDIGLPQHITAPPHAIASYDRG
jgi:hypothetical protein